MDQDLCRRLELRTLDFVGEVRYALDVLVGSQL